MHAVLEGCLNHVGLHHQVLVDEVGWVGVIGMDAADLGRGQVHLGGLFLFEEFLYGGLVGQVQLLVGSCDDGGRGHGFQLAHDGRAHHATVAGDVDAGRCCHLSFFRLGAANNDRIWRLLHWFYLSIALQTS